MPVHVMLACNDVRGNDAGRVEAVDLVDWYERGGIALALEGEALALAFLGGRGRFHAGEAESRVRLDRRHYPILAHRTWVGNWRWDMVWMRGVWVAQLLEHLRQRHWSCTEAVDPFIDLWDDPEPIPRQWARLSGVPV